MELKEFFRDYSNRLGEIFSKKSELDNVLDITSEEIYAITHNVIAGFVKLDSASSLTNQDITLMINGIEYNVDYINPNNGFLMIL